MSDLKIAPYPEWYIIHDREGVVHHVPTWKYIDGLQKEREALRAENERLREVLINLVERIDINGGLGEYKGGKPFALEEAKKALEGKDG